MRLPPKRELDIANVFSLSPRHLWFIAYLLMISLIAIGVWLAIQRRTRAGGSHQPWLSPDLIRSWWAVPVLASISAAILITKTGWVAGGTASNSLVPAPTLFAYYSLFFFFGWLLSGQTELLEDLKRGAWLRLGAGVLIAVPAFLLFYDSGDFTGNVGTPGILAEIDELRLYGLLTVGIVCWLTLFGIWGVLARYIRKESRVLRYFSDASFWIYLVHIPFLVALQSSLSTTELANPRPLGTCRERNPSRLALGTLCPDPWGAQAGDEACCALAALPARRWTLADPLPSGTLRRRRSRTTQGPEIPQCIPLPQSQRAESQSRCRVDRECSGGRHRRLRPPRGTPGATICRQ